MKTLLLVILGLTTTAFAAEGGSFWNMLTNIDAGEVKSLAANRMGLALLICFGSGVLTSFTPCVYPIIPITLNILGRASQAAPSSGKFNSASFKAAIVYVAGMCTTYSTVGLIAGMTGALFGNLLQSTWMLAFIAILFLALALSQMGIFKLQLPSSLQTKLAGVGNEQSKFGIFLMGIVSGLIVGPCVGPIITGILTFVLEGSNPFIGFLYFFSFSLGLGTLFLVLGAFSGLLSKLPRSGAWMNRINYALAGLLLIASGYYGVLLLKKVGILDRSMPAVTDHSGSPTEGVNWLSSESEALALAKETGKPVIIDFAAEWCEACHEIEDQVFKTPQATEALKAFVTLRFDMTEENDENDTIRKKYGVLGLPTIVFLDKNGNILDSPRFHGLMTLDKFLSVLDSVLKI